MALISIINIMIITSLQQGSDPKKPKKEPLLVQRKKELASVFNDEVLNHYH